MFAALLVIEASDVIFAIDSIPCILGLTQDRFLVYSSNMLAVLGLRSLYVLLEDLLHRVKHLQTGLGLVLAFVGIKMMAGYVSLCEQVVHKLTAMQPMVATARPFFICVFYRLKLAGEHFSLLSLTRSVRLRLFSHRLSFF